MLSFSKGSTLVLFDGANRYKYSVGSVSLNQTFIETTRDTKTIHRPINIDESIVNEKSTVSVDFSIYFTSDSADPCNIAIMRWFGFYNPNDAYFQDARFPLAVEGSVCNEWIAYLVSGNGTIYKVDKCVGENISFTLSKSSPMGMDITAIGAELTTVSSIPVIGLEYSQNYNNFFIASPNVNIVPRMQTVTCEITRDIRWLQNKTLHQVLSGEIYTKNTPVLTGYSVAGSIVSTKVSDDDLLHINDDATPIIITAGSSFSINIKQYNITQRWGFGNVHTLISDYKLQQRYGSLINADASFITY